jgi:hypothetical protein
VETVHRHGQYFVDPEEAARLKWYYIWKAKKKRNWLESQPNSVKLLRYLRQNKHFHGQRHSALLNVLISYQK